MVITKKTMNIIRNQTREVYRQDMYGVIAETFGLLVRALDDPRETAEEQRTLIDKRLEALMGQLESVVGAKELLDTYYEGFQVIETQDDNE